MTEELGLKWRGLIFGECPLGLIFRDSRQRKGHRLLATSAREPALRRTAQNVNSLFRTGGEAQQGLCYFVTRVEMSSAFRVAALRGAGCAARFPGFEKARRSTASRSLGPGNQGLRCAARFAGSGPNGFRTRVSGVRGQRPRPLDDGTVPRLRSRT